MTQTEEVINFEDYHVARNLFGNKDQNLKILEDKLDVQLIARGNTLKIIGKEEKVDLSSLVIKELMTITESDRSLTKREVKYAVELLEKIKRPF